MQSPLNTTHERHERRAREVQREQGKAFELVREAAALRAMLAGLDRVLVLCDRFGGLFCPAGQGLSVLFEDPPPTLHALLARAGQQASAVDTVLELLWDDSGFMSPFEATVGMLPGELSEGERTVSIEYKPLAREDGSLHRVMLVLSDVTERLAEQRAHQISIERVERLKRAASNLESYQSYVLEARALARRISGADFDQASPELLRALHTFKGVVGMYGHQEVSAQVHALEEALADGMHDSWERWERAHHMWVEQLGEAYGVLGLDRLSSHAMVARDKLAALGDALDQDATGMASAVFDTLERHPLDEVFDKYTYLVERRAASQDKRVVLVFDYTSAEVSHGEVRAIDAALVHLFNNALDHGFDAGAPELGRIEVHCVRGDDGGLTLTIRDDGKGIQTGRLVERAVRRGLWTQREADEATDAERLALVFEHGLSSQDQATLTSGRGVGMAAIYEHVTGLGGTLSVASTPGEGTTFTLDLPPLGSRRDVG